MANYAPMCDNVTTCDNFVFLCFHAVTICFYVGCDNVTTSQPRTPVCVYARTHEDTLSQMSHSHNKREISKLGCDNLKGVGCHVVTLLLNQGSVAWSGCKSTGITWFLMLTTRLASRGVVSELLTVLGRLMSLLMVIGTSYRDCLVVLPAVMQRNSSVLMTSLTKKVLLNRSRYGYVSRGVSLLSKYFFGVSFRFYVCKTGG